MILNFFKSYALVITITAIVLTLEMIQPWSSEYLAYHRSAIENGFEFWRFFSANLVHLSIQHSLLNLASIWLISFIFKPLLRELDWIYWLLLLYIANTIAMYFFVPDLIQYVGMSGALYGLIAALCVAEIRLGGKLSILLLIIVGIKIIIPRLLGGHTEYNETIGGVVIEEAHIIGYLQGIILGFIWSKSRFNETFHLSLKH